MQLRLSTSAPRAVRLLAGIAAALLTPQVLPAADLVWVGGNNDNAWDAGATLNWADLLGPVAFLDGDFVIFGDTGSNSPPVNVVGTVAPGGVTFTNSTGYDYTLIGGTVAVAGNMDLNGSGSVIVANTGLSAGGILGLNNGTLVLDPPVGSDFTLGSNLSGPGTLRKAGTGTAILSGDNSAFTGPIVVAAGTLKANGTAGVGTGGTEAPGVAVLDGATFDVLPTAEAGAEVVTIVGAGVDGKGALVASSGSDTIGRVNQVILGGNARIAANNTASNLVVGGTGGAFQGHGHDLQVFVDTGSQVDLHNVGETGINNVEISGDKRPLYLGGDSTLGPDTGTVTLVNARLGFYGPTSGADGPPSTITFTKPIVIDPVGGCVEVYPGSKAIDSPITMNGEFEATTYCTANSTTATVTLNGRLTGPGGLTAHLYANATTSRRGMVVLTADDNDYAGPTTISGGGGFKNVTASRDRVTLSIGNGGTTGSIGPADVTVTAPGTLQFNRTDSIAFANNVSGNGHVKVAAGTVLISGAHTATGTYTVAGGATLALGGPSPRVLAPGGVTLGDNAALSFRLDSPGSANNDRITVTGTADLTVAKALVVNATAMNGPTLPDGDYLLISAGTLSTQVPDVPPTLVFNGPAGQAATLTIAANELYLTIGAFVSPPDIEPPGGDGDVDLADFQVVLNCFSGPAVPFASGCDLADFDHDGDSDLRDFAVWQACFTGSGVQARIPTCTTVDIP